MIFWIYSLAKNIWILLKTFTTYVRPKLEYNTVVCSTHIEFSIIESFKKLSVIVLIVKNNISISESVKKIYQKNMYSM